MKIKKEIKKTQSKNNLYKNNLVIIIALAFLIAIGLIVNYMTRFEVQFAPETEFRVFVSNETFRGGFGSVFGADSTCYMLANQSGLPGNNWRAWLGNQFISISGGRFYESAVPYVMYVRDGTRIVVANNWADLTDGNLQSPIDIDQNGDSIGSERVWTGAFSNGVLSARSADEACNNWHGSSKVLSAMVGLSSYSDEKWTENSDVDTCGLSRHIYCFQQPELIQQRIRVFVTSDRYDGREFRDYVDIDGTHWTGLEALDALCNDYAESANLNRLDTIGWKAWISNTTTAMKDRYPHYELPFVRLADDVQIANGWTNLTDGILDAPINRDERGAYIDEKVWTHTNFDGSLPADRGLDACADWTSNSNESKAGRGDATSNTAWTSGDVKSCDDKERIYCFEMIQVNNEVCNDGVDNDGDGLTDCADDVCAGQMGQDGAICEPNSETRCDDGGDNDGDGFVDCSDSNCDGLPGPGGQICEYSGETQCSDGSDNDNDGDIDCQDFDCDGIDGCEFGSEASCGDGFDNDGDTLIDCLDNSCNGFDGCEFGQEQTCYDTEDNDGDTATDCLDSDCAEDLACEGFTVFVTSNRYPPTFGGTAGADLICQQSAINAGLGGTWKAWLSVQASSIADNICHSSIRYRLPDGTIVTHDWVDLTDGTLQSAINMDQNGNTITTGLDIWTHTALDGTTKGTNGTSTACADWTIVDTTIRAGSGRADSLTATWTDFAANRCSGQQRLICIQVPSTQQEFDALCYPSGGI